MSDLGLITDSDKSLVIDRNKIRRDKIKTNNELVQRDYENMTSLQSIYFDGRKDDTCINLKVSETKYKRIIEKEEHISVLSEPNSKYITHFVPTYGTAKNIREGLAKVIRKSENEDTLEAVGYDGTVTNTG